MNWKELIISYVLGCILIKNTMKGQEGIQMLLTAEHEAQQIISTAKNCKTHNLCYVESKNNMIEKMFFIAFHTFRKIIFYSLLCSFWARGLKKFNSCYSCFLI